MPPTMIAAACTMLPITSHVEPCTQSTVGSGLGDGVGVTLETCHSGSGESSQTLGLASSYGQQGPLMDSKDRDILERAVRSIADHAANTNKDIDEAMEPAWPQITPSRWPRSRCGSNS